MAKDNKKLKENQKEINGVVYTFQRLPVRPAVELKQRMMPGGQVDELAMYDELFEHIVIEPRITLDDFEFVHEADEVAQAALIYQYPDLGK